MFEMKPEFYTGIKSIDDQHAHLFELANEVYQLSKDEFTPDKYDNIVAVLDELREYARVHFKDEEDYMERIGYKRLFTQKMEHAEFMEKFDEINFNAIDENQDAYIAELYEFLSNWLAEHILEKDKLIGQE